MASAFPGGLDNFTNPTATDTLDSATVPHAEQHSNANDAIEAIESTLGVNPQGSSATVVARLTALDSTVAGKAPATGISPSAIAGTAVITTDSRLSDTRVPTNASVTDAKIATTLSPSKITGTAVVTSDSRLSDARTPTAHAATHGFAGSDPVTVASSQVLGLATSATTDTTNASNITSGTLPNARLSAVPNSALANSSVTVNGSAISLGGSATVTATPTDATVTDAKIATAGLAQSSLTSNVIADWAASTFYARNALVNYLGVAYHRITAGTSGATFDPTMWNAQTPALSVVASNISGSLPNVTSVNSTTIPSAATLLTDASTIVPAKGGTGATATTGTAGSSVLSISPTLSGTVTSQGQLAANTTSTTVPAVVVSPKGTFTISGVSASHTGSLTYDTFTVPSTAGLYVGQSVTLAGLGAFSGINSIDSINATLGTFRISTVIGTGNVTATGGTLTASGTQQNLQEWQRTDGTVLTSITPSGGIVTPLGTGVVHQTAGGAFTSSLITDSDVDSSAAIAQSKLALQKYMALTGTTVDIFPRHSLTISRALNSGTAYFSAYVPEKNITISTLSLSNQTQAVPSSGTNKTQVGIFSASGGTPSSVTCLSFSKKERTSTTTTAAAFGTAPSSNLETFALGYTITNGAAGTTNGAPTSLTLTAGTTYWIGICSYASAGFATGAAVTAAASLAIQFDPYVGVQNTGQSSTDFAVSTAITVATGPTAFPWFRLS